VTARTPSHRLLFRDTADHGRYQDLLVAEVEQRGWEVFTWCHMPTHVHLLLRTPRPNLAGGIKRAHETYATFINRRYDEHGHVFGDRFGNKMVRSDAHFIAILRYVARNPVTDGLCREPEDWAWGAHRALAGLDPAPDFVRADEALSCLGYANGGGRAAYRQLVREDDRALAQRLADAAEGDVWLVTAVDRLKLPIDVVAAVLGVGRRATFSRLADARRDTKGTVPFVS